MRSLSLTLCLLLVGAAVSRADEPINPERPGFTNGAAVVGIRTLQLEEGLTRADSAYRFGDGGVLRYGVASKTELRFGLPSWERGAGFSTASYGVKQQLTPMFAVIGQRTLEGQPKAQAALEGEFPLTEKLTVQADIVRDQQWSSGLNFGYALTERVGVFLEGYRAQGGHLDGGVTYLLTPDRQVDISAGDQFISVGFAWRLRL